MTLRGRIHLSTSKVRKIIVDISVLKVEVDGACGLERIRVLTIDSRIVVLKDSFVSDKKDNLWRLTESILRTYIVDRIKNNNQK